VESVSFDSLDSVNSFRPEYYVWEGTHPLIKGKCQIALEDTKKHLLLVELDVERRTRALLVKVMKKEGDANKNPLPICQASVSYFAPRIE
jgi:hypothetical protein